MNPRTMSDNKLFAGLGARQVAKAAAAAEHVAFASGERLWGEGDASRGVLLVLDGELAVTQRSASGAVVEVARLGPGDFLGATSTVLGTDIHSGTVTAATAVHAGLIPPDRFAVLTAAEPRLVPNAGTHLVVSLRRANARLLEAAARARHELERPASERTADRDGG